MNTSNFLIFVPRKNVLNMSLSLPKSELLQMSVSFLHLTKQVLLFNDFFKPPPYLARNYVCINTR